jgi:hypothetical protein
VVSTHTLASHIGQPTSVKRPSHPLRPHLAEQSSYCRLFYSRIVPGTTNLLTLSIVHTVLPPLPCHVMPCVRSARPGRQQTVGRAIMRCGTVWMRVLLTLHPDRCSRLCRQKMENGTFFLPAARSKKGTDTDGASTAKTQALRHTCTESRSSESSKQCQRNANCLPQGN